MADRSPAEVIREALARMEKATPLFRDEQAALEWVSNNVESLIRYKMSLVALPEQERDASDPIEAGILLAKDIGTRPRQVRIPWIDALLKEVAEAFFCELVPLPGSMNSWLIGRRTDRQVSKHVMGSLVPTAEKLGQEIYLREYHLHRKAGDVEAARGTKERYHFAFVGRCKTTIVGTMAQLEGRLGSLQELAHQSRLDVTEFMNDNFLPTRGNRTARVAPTKPPEEV